MWKKRPGNVSIPSAAGQIQVAVTAGSAPRAEQSNPRSNYAEEHILNLRSRRDIVSGWLVLGVNLLGRVYVVGKPGRLGLRDHSIKGMIKVLANCVSIRETEI